MANVDETAYLYPYPEFDDSPSPKCQWYFEDNGKWISYYDLSNFIEREYQKNANGKFKIRDDATPTTESSGGGGDVIIDFKKMVETFTVINRFPVAGFIKTSEKSRRLIRSIWFWHENDYSWLPYSPEVGEALERNWKKENCIVSVTINPPREIKKQSGYFTQFRYTSGGKPEGREVTRGFPGRKTKYRKPSPTAANTTAVRRDSLSIVETNTTTNHWNEFMREFGVTTQTECSPSLMTFDIFKYSLNILGFVSPNNQYKRTLHSPFASSLWEHFETKDQLLSCEIFDATMATLTRGDPLVCKKRAYGFIVSRCSSNLLKDGILATITLLEETLRSLNIGNRKKKMSNLEQQIMLLLEKTVPTEENYLNTLSEKIIQLYFSPPPLPRSDPSPVLSQITPVDHPLFGISINISVGIQCSTERTAASLLARSDVPILLEDFVEEYRFALPTMHYSRPLQPEILDSRVSFIEHAPLVFRELRRHFKVSDEIYLNSLGIEAMLFRLLFCGEFNTFLTVSSYGKSGGVFFYSYDSQFIIKTIKQKEADCLLKNLQSYYDYLTNKKTLIVPCLALYTVTEERKEPLYLCVMKNQFFSANKVDEIFDLKGSTNERTTTNKIPGAPLKDLDFENRTVILTPQAYASISSMIDSDVKFLSTVLQTIDYSLLLGIHWVIPSSIDDNGYLSYCQTKRYYFGIIDYLTEYGSTEQCAIRFSEYLKRKVMWTPPQSGDSNNKSE